VKALRKNNLDEAVMQSVTEQPIALRTTRVQVNFRYEASGVGTNLTLAPRAAAY
jgi:hypothetical protein